MLQEDTVTAEAAANRIHAYIRENFMYTRAENTLAPTASLLGDGILDSMGVMELVEFLESEFQIRVADEEITEKHLGTLERVAAYVESKANGGVMVS